MSYSSSVEGKTLQGATFMVVGEQNNVTHVFSEYSLRHSPPQPPIPTPSSLTTKTMSLLRLPSSITRSLRASQRPSFSPGSPARTFQSSSRRLVQYLNADQTVCILCSSRSAKHNKNLKFIPLFISVLPRHSQKPSRRKAQKGRLCWWISTLSKCSLLCFQIHVESWLICPPPPSTYLLIITTKTPATVTTTPLNDEIES